MPGTLSPAESVRDTGDRLLTAVRRIRRRGFRTIVSVDTTGTAAEWCLAIDEEVVARGSCPEALVTAAEDWLRSHSPRA